MRINTDSILKNSCDTSREIIDVGSGIEIQINLPAVNKWIRYVVAIQIKPGPFDFASTFGGRGFKFDLFV